MTTHFQRRAKQAERAATRKQVCAFWARAERFENENLAAANIIASDSTKCPPESLAARWAALVLAKASHVPSCSEAAA